MMGGRVHEKIDELHKQYGPAVRIAPDELCFFTAQSIKDIYSRAGPGTPQKSRVHYQTPINGVDHVTTALDDSVHKRQRSLIAWGLTGARTKSQEPLVTRYVDMFIKGLEREAENGPVDIMTWFNYTTFDITGDLIFAESFDCLKNNKLHPWIQLTFGAVKALAYINAARAFPPLGPVLMSLIPKSILQKGIDHFNLSAEKADRRIAMETNRDDLMSGMLKNGFTEDHGAHLKGGKLLSRAEIHSNAYMCDLNKRMSIMI